MKLFSTLPSQAKPYFTPPYSGYCMRKEPDYPMSFSTPSKHFVAHRVEVGWGKSVNLKIPICSASGPAEKKTYTSAVLSWSILRLKLAKSRVKYFSFE